MIRSAHTLIRQRQRLRPLVSAGSASSSSWSSFMIGTFHCYRQPSSGRTRQYHQNGHQVKNHNAASTAGGIDRLLVVGSGVAGSAAALIAAEVHRIPVTILFAGQLPVDCNSNWAQGGIIYRNFDPSSGDSADALAHDIHRAGAGLCDDDAVYKVATQGPERVRQLLLDMTGKFAQVPFDRRADGSLSLCLEASHGAPRILHRADHTGRIITEHITQAAARHPLITMQPHTLVSDLIVDESNGVCVGVQTIHRVSGVPQSEFATRGVVLATGGLSNIYQHSTNPAGFNALGSSVGLAVRAGVPVQDLEYVQFHPTVLYIPKEPRFLLTEALRGEGAVLRNAAGRAFAQDFHTDGELAPRDIVARGVFEEGQKSNGQFHNVFLDITHRNADWLHQRFPSIQQHLSQYGLDLAKDQMPITPAAHYTCGGISTDLHGRTGLPGLYAAGEAARTGLHGGNRLASTSLLEGLVFGASVADFVASPDGRDLMETTKLHLATAGNTTYRDEPYHRYALEPSLIENAAYRAMKLLKKLRAVMWDYVGVVRTLSGLMTAADEMTEIRAQATELHRLCPTLETTAVRDAAYAGLAVTQAALANRESKGAHCIVPDEEADDDTDDEQGVAAAAH